MLGQMSMGIEGSLGASRMRYRTIQPRFAMLTASTRLSCAAALLFALPIFTAPASADPLKDGPGYSFIDEVRIGAMAANLEDGSHGGDYTINGEVLFPRLGGGSYGDPIRDYFFHPRLHIGASISPGGVDQVYTGLTWDHHLTDRIFFETSFGAALQDGETSGNDPDSYGCSLNFRESASIGIELTEHLRVMATVDHMSNAGLCDGNQGLTNAGVRLGYRW
jgi:hypothetical protein